MAGKTIYPSIPAPGNDSASLRATVDAMRQTLTMVIMNAQNPNPNFTPSSASQIFVTQDQLKATGVVGPSGPAGPQGPPGPGIAEAPNDANTYGRSQLTWQPVMPIDGSAPFQIPSGAPLYFNTAANVYSIIVNRDPAGSTQGWGIAFGGSSTNSARQFGIINPAGQMVLWIGSDGVIHVNAPIVVGP